MLNKIPRITALSQAIARIERACHVRYTVDRAYKYALLQQAMDRARRDAVWIAENAPWHD